MFRQDSATVLKDFQRTIRDEPYFYIYKVKIFVKQDTVSSNEVISWLHERYVGKPRGHRYRVVTYKHNDGERYVDYILMESCSDDDLVYMKMRWGYSHTKVARGNKVQRKRLTKQQKVKLDAILQRVTNEFYDNL